MRQSMFNPTLMRGVCYNYIRKENIVTYYCGTNPTEENLNEYLELTAARGPIGLVGPAEAHVLNLRNCLYWASLALRERGVELVKAQETSDKIAADLAIANVRVKGLDRSRIIWRDAARGSQMEIKELRGQVSKNEDTIARLGSLVSVAAGIDLPALSGTIEKLQEQYRYLSYLQQGGKSLMEPEREAATDLNDQVVDLLNGLGLRTGFGLVFGKGSRA